MVRLVAESLFFDDEANTWHYRVPALHINGSARRLARTPSASALLYRGLDELLAESSSHWTMAVYRQA
ncbi:MAG: hypothetical protein M3186_03485 [Actinomycetota bacterium]|nr:hypothetical protein [Actinomycetota bacterium]